MHGWFVALFWVSTCERGLAVVVGGLPNNQCRNRIWNRFIDHYQFVISNQIKFYFRKCTWRHGTSCMSKKGQGLLSQSGSIYIHTLRLSLAQQMGATHHSGSALTPISEASRTHLWQPYLMHSCQGMEMFLLQPCSALAALVKLTYWPLSPQILVPQTFSYIQATLNGRGGGHVNA